MSKFERLLEPGSTELPDCRCAAEMNLMAIVPVPGGDSEIRFRIASGVLYVGVAEPKLQASGVVPRIR